MTLPHLPGVEPAIAAKKLVAVGGLDYSHGRVGPGEEGIIVRDRRLRFLARVVSLFWRGNDFVSRNLGCAKLADGLRTRRNGSDCRYNATGKNSVDFVALHNQLLAVRTR